MNIFDEFARLDRKGRARLLRQVKEECKTYPDHLVRIPMSPFVEKRARDEGAQIPIELWRSRGYFVQIFEVNEDYERLTVSRNAFTIDLRRFMDGITWEQLFRLKTECGRGDVEAVEIFPRREDEVNVANLRHLWVRKTGSLMRDEDIGWTRSQVVNTAEPFSMPGSQARSPFVPFGVDRMDSHKDFTSVLGVAQSSSEPA